jgi:lipid A disaccharide synthetase
LQEDARPEAIASELAPLLDDEKARADFQTKLQSFIAKLGEPGASARAAEAILAEISAQA